MTLYLRNARTAPVCGLNLGKAAFPAVFYTKIRIVSTEKNFIKI